MLGTAAVLKTTRGKEVALKDVNVNAELTDLVSNVAITQTYQNLEGKNIEAIYTFPLPLDAVLLDLTVVIGSKVLKGQVVEKKQAEEQYEEAITDGDTAIMLQEVQPGLLTMNVGNILAGEIIVINFYYGMLHTYQGKSLRFMMPTTISPRYGNPLKGGFEPHQIPEHTLQSNYKFSLNVSIKGLLVGADIDSPTHFVSITSESDQVVVSLNNEQSQMDRDFVLNFDNISTVTSAAHIEKDHKGYVALASFYCDFDIREDASPRSFKIVVDCSGSMAGDSIHQAKKALLQIVDSLRDGDFINIFKFGSHYETFSNEQQCVNNKSRENLMNYVGQIDATMGGTEMAAALDATYDVSNNMEIPHDVLLITDGEAWNEAELVHNAKLSHHRIFTVGVGSSVAENVVRELADVTGGACELVTPNEVMAEKIHRHFKRMFSPRAKDVNISWSAAPRFTSPEKVSAVYAGDTLHVFGWFDSAPEGNVELQITLPNGDTLTEISPYSAVTNEEEKYFLARMGVSNLIRKESSLDESSKTRKAVEYQLMSPWTNYLVVYARGEDEAVGDLPDVRKVPHTLAAGWGGMGNIIIKECCDVDKSYSMDGAVVVRKPVSCSVKSESRGFDEEMLDIPSFLRRSASTDEDAIYDIISDEDDSKITDNESSELIQLIKNINQQVTILGVTAITSLKLSTIKRMGAPDTIIGALRDMIDADHDEKVVVLTFLKFLVGSEYKKHIDRQNKRIVLWLYTQMMVDKTLLKEMRSVFTDILEEKVI